WQVASCWQFGVWAAFGAASACVGLSVRMGRRKRAWQPWVVSGDGLDHGKLSRDRVFIDSNSSSSPVMRLRLIAYNILSRRQAFDARLGHALTHSSSRQPPFRNLKILWSFIERMEESNKMRWK